MKSHTTQSFRDALALLPPTVQRRAHAAYRRFQANPQHSGLQFKKVHATKPVYSARINDDYRVVGMIDGGDIVWF